MGAFLKHLWLIPNILLKWWNYKIFTKPVPSQMPSRSSHWRCSVKEDILKTLQNFSGKHLHWSLFQTLFKRDSNTGVFQWNLQSFYEHLFWTISANDCFCPYQDFQNLILTSSWRHRFLYNNIINKHAPPLRQKLLSST